VIVLLEKIKLIPVIPFTREIPGGLKIKFKGILLKKKKKTQKNVFLGTGDTSSKVLQ
jgi:hypothetical protein